MSWNNFDFVCRYTVKNFGRSAILTIKKAVLRKRKIRIPVKIAFLRIFKHFLSKFMPFSIGRFLLLIGKNPSILLVHLKIHQWNWRILKDL